MTSSRGSHMRVAALGAAALLGAACTGGVKPTVGPSTGAGNSPAATTPGTSPASGPTPIATVIDGLEVRTMSLGAGVAPIDVVAAFGSLWVAGHRSNAVSRIDPATMQEIASIQVGSGPGWFGVTEDAVWITSQLGRGLSRIDPATNTADVRVGGWATCWGPAIGAGYLWQLACDAGVIMRIDLATNEATDIYADDYLGVGFVGDTLVAVAPDGLERLDPATGELEPLGDKPEGFPVAFDDRSIWWAGDDAIRRVGFADGAVLATVPIGGEVTVTFAGDRGWVTQFGGPLHEIDPASDGVLRTLPLGPSSVAREIDGVVWVTSFDANTLSRFEP